MKLRAVQDETNGFVTFIPLAFHPAEYGLSIFANHRIRRYEATSPCPG